MVLASLWQFAGDGPGVLILWIAVGASLCTVGYYLIGKLREKLRETGPTASDFVTNFRELRERGELTDEEYRTIKAMLASRIKEQVKTRKSNSCDENPPGAERMFDNEQTRDAGEDKSSVSGED